MSRLRQSRTARIAAEERERVLARQESAREQGLSAPREPADWSHMGAAMHNEELYCLLVPLHEERLLLPRGCVSEVINYQVPTPMEGAPPWYLGSIAWSYSQTPEPRAIGIIGSDS